ncbi:MAG: NADH-quinone oxidoreductase subunit C, partial [Acidimicrobiales bacterium]|nr:NADH-quinone oxidoreductase subunit C [Acidimicrobiales bacterium]
MSRARGMDATSVGADQIEATTRALVRERHARLADLFGDLEEGQLVLRAVYALDHDASYTVIGWPVDGEQYSALSDIAPAAFVEECEVYEQFGVRPAGGKPLNRLVLPPYADRPFPRLGSGPRTEARPVHAPHLVAGEALEFPFGPVRAVGQESLYVGLVTNGEEVIDLY